MEPPIPEPQWDHVGLSESRQSILEITFVKVGKTFLKSHSIQRLFQPLRLKISIAYIIPFNSTKNALV